MQILIFGLTISSSWGNGHASPYRALIRALRQQDIHVIFFERDVPYYAKHRDFAECSYCELVLYQDWDSVRDRALAQARESDVVVTASYLPVGACISAELLEIEGPLHVFYDLDTPITLHRLESGGVDYLTRELIPRFELYISFTGGRILHCLEQEYGARLAKPLYGCVDPDAYQRVSPREEFTCWFSYMGTYAADRRKKVQDFFLRPAQALPKHRFLLAGSMYPPDLGLPPNIKHLEHVSPADHPQLYSSSRATLNLTRAEMANAGYCPSGRFFEAAACGTPLLTDKWEGLDFFFNSNEELFVIESGDDVQDILQLPDAELNRRAARARERTLDEHTGQCRARQFLAYCDEARQFVNSAVETLP